MLNEITEIDMDGVLVNIHDYLQQQVGLRVFEMSTRYRLEENPQIPETIISTLYSLFNEADTYLFAKPHEGAVEFVKRAAEKGTVILHSLASNEECKKAKECWIRQWLSGVNIEVMIDIGHKTMLSCSTIVVEDNPENLRNSSAARKILINKSYNQQKFNSDYDDLFNEPGFLRVDSLADIA